MKGYLKCLLATAVLTGSIFGLSGNTVVEAANGEGGPKLAVLVDGRKVKFKGGDPVSEKGRVQVPLRGIGEALNAKIGFSGKTVTYKKDGKSIVLTLGSKSAEVNGKKVTMDTPAKAVKGRTYVPLRFVSENLGVPVNWDQVGNWVWIGSKEVPDIEDVPAVKKFGLTKSYTDLYGKDTFLLDGKKDVRVFTIDDLPLKIDGFVVYDIWKETNASNNYPYLQARFTSGAISVAYLQKGFPARYRSQANPERAADKTYIKSYTTWSDTDEINGGDKTWRSFRIENADYIALNMSGNSLTLMINPFK